MQACSCYVGLSLEQNAARTGTASVSLPVWGPVGLITVGGCRRAAKRAGSTAAMAMACLTALSGGED